MPPSERWLVTWDRASNEQGKAKPFLGTPDAGRAATIPGHGRAQPLVTAVAFSPEPLNGTWEQWAVCPFRPNLPGTLTRLHHTKVTTGSNQRGREIDGS